MFMYIFSIGLIVFSNILYNICQKATPGSVNPFSSLMITYVTAALLTGLALCFYKTDQGLLRSFAAVNWTSVALGVSIVGLEFGYLMAYRAGWDISVGSLVANIFLAVMLIPVGIFFFKEGFAVGKVLGVIFCLIGLVLINKP